MGDDSKDDGLENKNGLKFCANILCAASKVFERMLTVDMKEKRDKVIEIEADNQKDVDDMLYFMCTDELKSDCNALGIIELAHYYQMYRLFLRCAKKLNESVSVPTFVKIICVFDKYEISAGYDSLIEFGKIHIEELKKQKDFDKLHHSVRCMVAAKGK